MTSSIPPEVLLVYPPYGKPIYRGGLHYTAIPLGIAYMAAVLEGNGVSVSVVDCNVTEVGVQGLADTILESTPGVVGITVTSPGLRYTRALILELRGRGVTSSIPVVAVGGPHVTADPDSSEGLGADVCFTGETEYTFTEYVGGLLGGRHPTTDVIHSQPIEDLDSLPHPARHLFMEGEYRFTSIATSRGCPFKCIYCSGCGTEYRKRSIDNIRGEVDTLSNSASRIKSIDFTDDVFTLDRPYAKGIAALLRDYGIPWSCTTRADLVDHQTLSHLADCGCTHISFGVESGSEEIRYGVGKNIPDSMFTSAFKSCRDVGVKTRAYAMIGLPGETLGDMQRTFEFVNSLEPDAVLYSPTIVYPGTELMGYCIQHNLIRKDAWVEYMEGRGGLPYFTPEGVSADEIFSLCYGEMKRFYLTPKQIYRRMRGAQSLEDLTDSLKAAVSYLAEPFLDNMT